MSIGSVGWFIVSIIAIMSISSVSTSLADAAAGAPASDAIVTAAVAALAAAASSSVAARNKSTSLRAAAGKLCVVRCREAGLGPTGEIEEIKALELRDGEIEVSV